MAAPDSINPQFTNGVAQGNTKLLAESPAVAVSRIYETIAHSTGILFENAVAAQQQQNAEAQAATNQGVMQIYNLDTTASGAATQEISVPSPEALQARTAQAMTATGAALARQALSVDAQVEAAIRLDNESVLGHAAEVAHAARLCAEALAASLQTVSRALHDDLMRTIKAAATAACLQGMLRDPSKAADYEAVLARIDRLH